MLALRDRDVRGKTELGWLSSRHTFSFGHYRDPDHMGFRSLRVINDDRVIPGAGFPRHRHNDMEIISYVLEGQLAHKDSLGTGTVIRAGEIQIMSAGAGVTHSEYNASTSQPVRFLQMWITPSAQGIAPNYQQKPLPSVADGETRLDLIASPDGRENSVTINQDVQLYRGVIAADGSLSIPIASTRHAWVQIARGIVEVEGGELREGDGLALSEIDMLTLTTTVGAEILVFDLA